MKWHLFPMLFQLVKRHASEIFTSVIVSTVFSLYSTAILGRLVQLEPTLIVSILPRSITVALALSIVSFFEGTSFYTMFCNFRFIYSGELYNKIAFGTVCRCQFISHSCCGGGNWFDWSKLCASNSWQAQVSWSHCSRNSNSIKVILCHISNNTTSTNKSY